MKTVTVTGTFDPKATRTITLVPGRNTGTREYPCPECKSTSSQHFTHCRHYLYQRQYLVTETCNECSEPVTLSRDSAEAKHGRFYCPSHSVIK